MKLALLLVLASCADREPTGWQVVTTGATWCAPCIAAWHAADRSGLDGVALVVSDDPAHDREAMASLGLEHLRVVLVPPDGPWTARFGGDLPSTYLLDRRGDVRSRQFGNDPRLP